MLRKLAVATLASLMTLAALDARAVCTAANPNASVPENTPTAAFTDHGNGTVTHTLTGLMWKKCPQGLSGAACTTGTASQLTWSQALASAVADPTGGHSDWRLPNKKELESIIEECGHSPAINLTVFPGTPVANFWSSTTYAVAPAAAWDVDFKDGATFNDDKTISTIFGQPFLVRLVRAGQPFDSFDAQLAPPPVKVVLDIDLSAPQSKYDALSDGLIVIRYLFGLTGPPLVNGALGGTATRTDPDAIKTYLDSVRASLDVDGNNNPDALTDGLLIIRYLFGLRGSALINGAVDPAGSRNTAPLIEEYIQTLMP